MSEGRFESGKQRPAQDEAGAGNGSADTERQGPAPGKVTRTSKLAARASSNPGPMAAAPARSNLDPLADPGRDQHAALTARWLDTAVRPDLHPPPVQRKPDADTSADASIDPPQPGIDKPGFIDHGDGSNIRTGPAELHGVALTAQPLPPATRVFVSGQHPRTSAWWYVSAFLPNAIVRGYVQGFRVNTDLPEPGARLYQIQPGDTVERLAVQEFSAAVRPGRDLRYYENVLLAVNRDKKRAGIHGTFQDPGILGGGADNIQLEAGRRIWLVSPAYARALEGQVPDGSLTNGAYAQAKHVLGHIEDLVQSVTESPQYMGTVAGVYAAAIQEHLPEIVGITAGFILAEATSAFLAATPTGVGQLAALMIQLALAAFGAKFAVDAAVQALEHGERWLTLAWTAHGDPAQRAEASKAFLAMLVSIAMAALAIAGVSGNMGKGLKIADAIHIQPPGLAMAPAMATANGSTMGGGMVFTPGSIATTGPVDIGISTMAAVGAGGSKADALADAGRLTGAAGDAGRIISRGTYRPGARASDKLLFSKEKFTAGVQQLTEARRVISKSETAAERQAFLGENFVKIGPGKWRSIDGARQFRVKPNDYAGSHGNIEGHVHLEFLRPNASGSKLVVWKNIHIPLR